jgi:hypothetical protein
MATVGSTYGYKTADVPTEPTPSEAGWTRDAEEAAEGGAQCAPEAAVRGGTALESPPQGAVQKKNAYESKRLFRLSKRRY